MTETPRERRCAGHPHLQDEHVRLHHCKHLSCTERRVEKTLRWPFDEQKQREPTLSEKPVTLLGCSGGIPPRSLLCDGGRRCYAFHWPRLLSGEPNRLYYLESLLEFAPWEDVSPPNARIIRSVCQYTRAGCECESTCGSTRGRPVNSMNDQFCDVMEDLTERIFTTLCPDLPPEAWPTCAHLHLDTNGSEGIPWHTGDEPQFRGKTDDCPIVTLSLGALREFWLSLNCDPESTRPDFRGIVEADMESGDLVAMEGLCQKYCIHHSPPVKPCVKFGASLDEVTASEAVRLSITWRWVREHEPQCPLREQAVDSQPFFAAPLSSKRVPDADTASLWTAVDQQAVRWRKRCAFRCCGHGRNCVQHSERWVCRRCLHRQLDCQEEEEALRKDPVLTKPDKDPVLTKPDALAVLSALQEALSRAKSTKQEMFSKLEECGPPRDGLLARCIEVLRDPGARPSAQGRLGQALFDFDGPAYGEDCLTLARGARLVQLQRRGGSEGWMWGAVVADAGWFPEEMLGLDFLTTPEADGPAEAEGAPGDGGAAASLAFGQTTHEFDGSPYGEDYLTFVKGSTLVKLEHPRIGGGWDFGAHFASTMGWFPASCFRIALLV